MDGQVYLKNVVSLELDEKKCTGCGICIDVCPHEVFEMEGRKAQIISRDSCIECGGCYRNCPVGAISVNAGVGCATAIIIGAIKGTEPTCGRSTDEKGEKNSCC